jgi:hypothetical protein
MSTHEHKASLSNAIAFKLENPEEKATIATRIYSVNDVTIRTNLQRIQERNGKAIKHGGHNKVLLEV